MMKGIYFDEIHSYKDLNLVLSSVSIPPAAVKTNYIDIPGADGSIDLTEALGAVRYKDRSCSFVFSVFPYEDFEEKKTQISNLLNGKRCKIRLDKDAEYYWLGRCSVNNYASDRNLHKITVNATVEPYKYKVEQTSAFVPFCEKNLLPVPAPKTAVSQGVTWEITNDKRFIGSGTPTAYSVLVLYSYTDGFVLGKGTYTISFSGTCENVSVDVAIRKADGTKVTVINSKPMPATFTIPEACGVYLALKRRTDNIPINLDCFLQIEPGTQATPYEAYTPSTEEKETILTNGRKVVCPYITCSNDNTAFTVGELEFTLNKGTHKVLDFQLQEGETAVSIQGTGAVIINYREGDL